MTTTSAKLTNPDMAPARKSLPSIWHQIQSLLNTINHILIGLIAIYITALARSLSFQDTAMHAFMTMIGFHVLMAEALMSHYPINFVTRSFAHRTKSRIHGILQLVGGSMALYGAVGKFLQTEETHFTTLHGKIGLAATFMCLASVIGGLVNYFQPKFALKIYTISEIKLRHNFFGMITFTLGIATIFLGYRTKFTYKHVDPELIVALSLATVLVYILTMIAPLRSLLTKLKYKRQSRK